MTVKESIRELLYKHFPEVTTKPTEEFVEALSLVVNKTITKAFEQQTKEGAYISIRELEEMLTTTRQLREIYDDMHPHTGSDMIKIDELKQLEYKLTEKIMTNRN